MIFETLLRRGKGARVRPSNLRGGERSGASDGPERGGGRCGAHGLARPDDGGKKFTLIILVSLTFVTAFAAIASLLFLHHILRSQPRTVRAAPPIGSARR